MPKWLPWAALLLAVLGFLDAGMESIQSDRFQVSRDSLLAVSVQTRTTDSLTALWAEQVSRRADATTARADRETHRADSLSRLAHRPIVVPPPDTTLRDSLRYALQVGDTLSNRLHDALLGLQTARGALDSLRVALDSQKQATASLRGAFEGERDRADGLANLLKKTPSCHKIPLLGISLPKVGIGYALTTHGVAPAVAVIIPLGCS